MGVYVVGDVGRRERGQVMDCLTFLVEYSLGLMVLEYGWTIFRRMIWGVVNV